MSGPVGSVPGLLSKMPFALKTTMLLVQHVFRLHSIPQDIVLDRGPQLTSRVWTAFCQALGCQLACLRLTTLKPMARWSGLCVVSLITIQFPGPPTSFGWRMLTTPGLPCHRYCISPLMVDNGFHPPLFRAQETDVTVPSVHSLIRTTAQNQ